MGVWDDSMSNNQATGFANDFLKKAMAVLSGKLNPTELPEYRLMNSMMAKQLMMAMSEISKKISQGGVTGGGVNKMMTDLNEGLLKNQIGAQGEAMKNITSQGFDMAKFLGSMSQNAQNMLLSAWNARSGRKQQESMFNKKMWLDLGTKAAAAGAAPFTGGASLGLANMNAVNTPEGQTAAQTGTWGSGGSGYGTEWYK